MIKVPRVKVWLAPAGTPLLAHSFVHQLSYGQRLLSKQEECGRSQDKAGHSWFSRVMVVEDRDFREGQKRLWTVQWGARERWAF